ncbi:MAG: hypothetical protein WA017_11040, partial [Desulfosalsimonadaceae bacterium]
MPDGNTVNAIYPVSLSANPNTNKIYVANSGSPSISIIDGATGAVTNVGIGVSGGTRAIAVNKVTNKVYFTAGSGSEQGVWVLDGASNVAARISYLNADGLGDSNFITVNEITNKIYIPCRFTDSVAVIDGATNSITNVLVGDEPTGLAINEVTNKIYVANWEGRSLSVIDGLTNNVINIPLGFKPASIVVSSNTNRVCAIQYGGIAVIDGATNSITDTLSGSNFTKMAVDESRNRLYVFSSGASIVYAFSLEDLSPLPEIDLGVNVNLSNMAVNEATNRIYVIGNPTSASGPYSQSGSKVFIVNGQDSSVATCNIGQVSGNYTGIIVSEQTNKVYVSCNESNFISIVNEVDNSVYNIHLGFVPVTIAADEDAGKLYVADGASDRLAVVDRSSGAVNYVGVVDIPLSIAVNEVNNKIYVANRGHEWDYNTDFVSIIDRASYSVVNVSVGDKPNAIAINRMTNKIYVANYGSLSVSIIDGNTNAVSFVFVSGSPRDIAVNEVTNKIYVAQDGYLSVVDGTTNQVTNLYLNTSYGPVAVAVNDVTNMVYAAHGSEGRVWVVNGVDNSVLPLSVADDAHQIAIDKALNRIFVCSANYLSIIDGATNSVSQPPTGGNFWNGLALNDDTHLAFIRNETGFPGNITIKIIDGMSGVQIAEIEGGVRGWFSSGSWHSGGDINLAAVDKSVNKMYALKQDSGSILVISQIGDAALETMIDHNWISGSGFPVNTQADVTVNGGDKANFSIATDENGNFFATGG